MSALRDGADVGNKAPMPGLKARLRAARHLKVPKGPKSAIPARAEMRPA
jgi:hypothetical protein